MTATAHQQTATSAIHDDAPARDEWTADRIDVDAYFTRIGYDGPINPSVETLFALHRAHALAIPFENLDIILGRGVSLDLDQIQDKMIRRRRGGYCFEHNLLFAALLQRLGFSVRRHLGRVLSADPGRVQPRTHMAINVDAEGAAWHADVGFGTALTEPIPLSDGAEVDQGGWRHGLARHADGSWALRSFGPEGWSERYVYTQEPQHHIDYVAASHYTATHPDSHFTWKPVAVRIAPEGRYRLNGLELTISTPDGGDERRELTPRDFETTLRWVAGIELEPGDTERLLAAVERRSAPAAGQV